LHETDKIKIIIKIILEIRINLINLYNESRRYYYENNLIKTADKKDRIST